MTTTSLAPASMTISNEDAAKISGLARPDDVSGNRQQIPILKINYEVDSGIPAGSWVVGMTKDKEGNIVDEGQKVLGIVILAVRDRYNLFDINNQANNCSSPYFMMGDETVHGNKHGYPCGKNCPYRDQNLTNRCKAEKVVFGLALTEGKKWVDCIAYVRGASYIPLTDYLRSIQRVKAGDGRPVEVPPFAFFTKLETEPKKNGSIKYWQAKFKVATIFPVAKIVQFAKLRDKTIDYIQTINEAFKRSAEAEAGKTEEKAPMKTASRKADGPADYDDSIDVSGDVPDGIMDFPPAGESKNDTVNLDAETGQVPKDDADDFDIESAIRQAVSTDNQ